MLTFHAAVARKDSKGYPMGGFQMENALTREETLRGMTIWALISEKKSRSWQMGRFCDLR
jgi:predicted amidohydrolase YtcJ